MKLKLFLFILIAISLLSCNNSNSSKYQTENVIIVVIDGPRYSETWGDSTHQHIPRMVELSKQGVVYTNFYNDGPTYTNAGHVSISTGNYQEISNDGTELPKYPSILQYWNKKYEINKGVSWVITSKDKLEILANCEDSLWTDKYQPSTNCGVDGLGTSYRNDSITFLKIIEILSTYHPNLVFINLKEPDGAGHANDWEAYLQGIEMNDEHIYQLWNYVETDPQYKGKTTLLVTNDHGRHLDSIADGFISHGDDCEGCRHINLLAIGPDFKQNIITGIRREQIDISTTVAELLEFEMPTSKGNVMEELFK